jgi:hypothetical protein
MKRVFYLLSLTAFITLLPAARAADPSGTWKGAFEYQGSSIPVTVHLKVDGSKVTGTLQTGAVEGLGGATSEIHDGMLAGDTVSFSVNADYQGQTYKLVYKGKVAVEEISFDFGTDDGSWSAPLIVKRSTDTVAAPAAAPAPDITGDWKGTFDVNGTPTEMKFHLKSSGSTVTGTIERPGAPPMEVHEGKIDGDTVSFWINTDYEGQTYTIVYKGKVTPGQIVFDLGTADQSWSAQMTAKKS